ncbi:hypothetical protein [Streptomyces sp. V4I2]|uniref:hypothetical protein n=1 Tax=Streptomyces sp. V4I2 TaxID=3042280 RepID=UPI002789D153|nr:hypothetical protein [Streptomyces sp. V4I2]MDQ1041948.1 2,4-dienoyl-CoA reductase-like NADH-dependent reductase (Old Yellow Enzyme family) [Streptomyces sp. V4I2]
MSLWAENGLSGGGTSSRPTGTTSWPPTAPCATSCACWAWPTSPYCTERGGDLVQELRRRFDGKLIVNNGPFGGQTTREQALQQIEADHADAVAVGRAHIANPDLVERWQGGHPENEPRPELFYGPGAEGYTDYPFLEAA